MNELATSQTHALSAINKLEQQLANASTPAESAQVARAARSLAEVARGALSDRQTAASYDVVFWRAARQTGGMLKGEARSGGPGRGKKNARSVQSFGNTLADAALDHETARRWQQFHVVDEQLFVEFCERYLAGEEDSTAFALLGSARMRVPPPSVPIPPPTGTYRCVVIDPPWPMQKIEREERPLQGVALNYLTSTLSLEQLADEEWLPARATMAPDGCHVYLWVTHRFLPDGLELFEKWKVNYQCLLTWVKPVGPTPFSWMYDTEHVLFGTKGSLKLERLGLRLSFEAPVQGHSVKPDVFYERVATASPGPRIDMFARQERDGFEVWGNEITDDG